MATLTRFTAAPPDMRTVVFVAVCKATEGIADMPVDVREVFGYTGMYEGDVLSLLTVLDGEGFIVLDEEEDEAAVSLTTSGSAWAMEHWREWE